MSVIPLRGRLVQLGCGTRPPPCEPINAQNRIRYHRTVGQRQDRMASPRVANDRRGHNAPLDRALPRICDSSIGFGGGGLRLGLPRTPRDNEPDGAQNCEHDHQFKESEAGAISSHPAKRGPHGTGRIEYTA
jgi:hypothetical protein